MHIVWDWNGTLFDDLDVVVRSVNHGLEGFGAIPIDLDGYRSHYTRPVKLFYDRLIGREITAGGVDHGRPGLPRCLSSRSRRGAIDGRCRRGPDDGRQREVTPNRSCRCSRIRT